MICVACNGKGKDGYHKTEVCNVCNGSGQVKDIEVKIEQQKVPENIVINSIPKSNKKIK